MELIDLKAQYQCIEEEIKESINNVLRHGKYIMGPEVTQLESELASYVGTKYCISCANGTDALQIALMALDTQANDIIFAPTFSFFATVEPIPLLGAKVWFVDVEEDTCNMSASKLEDAIRICREKELGNPKAVIAVNLFGQTADYGALAKICQQQKLNLIEDAAQSFGAEFQQKKSCSLATISTTSFFPAKPLGCYGDGGALFTNSDELAEKIRSIRVHGKGTHKYENIRIGLNSRLDTIQAAILLCKLKLFPNEVKRRNKVANIYKEALQPYFWTQKQLPDSTSVWAQFCLQHPSIERSRFIHSLKEKGIPSAIYYPTTLCAHPPMQNQTVIDQRVAEQISKGIFSIPMHPYLSDSDQNKIIECLLESGSNNIKWN